MISTRGVRGARVACAALTPAASTMPAFADAAPFAASPHAAGWSESKVTQRNASLFASTRPDAQTTWVAGIRIIPQGGPQDHDDLVATVWERDERKGSGWKPMKTAPVPQSKRVRFVDIDASSRRNAMVVGDYAKQAGGVVTQHWNGNAWKSAVAPVPRETEEGQFFAVDTRAPDDAWAVGYASRRLPTDEARTVGLLQHWDGSRWKQQKLPDIGKGYNGWALHDVTALAADDVWAVGSKFRAEDGKPVVLHYDGTRWSEVATPALGAARTDLYAVAVGPGGGHMWAVGGTWTADTRWQGLSLRYDGKKWVNVPLPKGTRTLESVAISQGDPVVLTHKTEESSAALRYSGGRWVSMNLTVADAKPYLANHVSVAGRTIDVTGMYLGTGSQDVTGPGTVLTARR
ncbi:hypothetical protein [Streptomyces sp. NPDC048636]|uniref:hypothetical protein n=1 Tax=Streptomyces sp. NPDC048636 TaxID=3155762 RepID=UPI0034382F1F